MKPARNTQLAVALVCLTGLAVTMLTFWMDHFSKATVQVQAEMSAANWIAGFERSVPDLDQLLLGEPISSEQRQSIETTMLGSSVFGVQIFDAAGKKLFDSSLPGLGIPQEHGLNFRAAQVARTGTTDLSVEAGDVSLGEPESYAEAYMAFYGGRPQPIGSVELYVDVSGSVAALSQKFGWVGAFAIAATLLVLVVPGLAVVKQHESLKERDRKLSEMARTDALTGLLNRRGVDQELAALPSSLGLDDRAWLLQIDLDKFKPVNDVLGHQVGDELLARLARRLRYAAGPDAIVGRTGGDEFLVCLKTQAPEKQVFARIERLRLSLLRPIRIDGNDCCVGASIGAVGWSRSEGWDVIEAVRYADVALQKAKEGGRNKVVMFEPSMQDRVLHDAKIAEDVTLGLSRNEFTAYFQPIVDAGSEQVVGFEALARWTHPERGLLLPGDFMQASEKAGLVPAIDQVILRDAIAFAKQLKASGREDLQVSINLSGIRLKEQETVDEFVWQLAANDLQPSQFRLELLESILLDDRSDNATDILKRFHHLGFKIDLDDFGTGHAAIASLHRYPIDRIKIDRSLISGIGSDPQLAILTEAVAALGYRFGVEVLAEGIERQDELDIVRKMKVGAIQGFLFSKAKPAHECLDQLAADTVAQSVPAPSIRALSA